MTIMESALFLSVDVYWSFRSPYCYFVAPRLLALARDLEVSVRLRPIYPLAVRVEGFFKKLNPLGVSYFFRDIKRVGDKLEMPIVWPDPDPIVMNFATGDVSPDQPYISRLTRLGVLAEEAGSGMEFARQVSALIFSGTKNWHEGDLLRAAVAQAGLDLEMLDRTADSDGARLEKLIEQNETAHTKAGH